MSKMVTVQWTIFFFYFHQLLFKYSSMKSDKKTRSGFFLNTIKQQNRGNTKKESEDMIKINNRFYLTTTKYSHQCYNSYNGIDIKESKWIVAYLKISSVKFNLSKKIKEELRNSVSPKIIWEGTLQINNTAYSAEIHECLGPSVEKMFETIHVSLTSRQLLHLLLQMLKLLQKLSNSRFVHGQLSTQVICFDPSPKNNDLYLLNCLQLRKKNQEIKPICTKYCSRGSHHGRNLHVKDDLQAIVYILVDIFLDKKFFGGVQPCEYQNKKNSLNLLELPRSFPIPFIEFFCSVNDLNLAADFNFFYWKNYLSKLLTPAITNNPYTWMLADRQNNLALQQSKSGYDYVVESIFKMELVQKIEYQELIQFNQSDMENKENIKEKIIKKVVLKQISN